jgi:hypothetical protein
MSTATNNSEFDCTKINEMSFEEIWQFGYDKIIEQGKPSYSITPSSYPDNPNKVIQCLYRDGKGNKCLFGHMIPDDLYDEDFEVEGIAYILSELEVSVNRPGLEGFLNELQSAHDCAARDAYYDKKDFIKEFKANMRNVADSYKLNV